MAPIKQSAHKKQGYIYDVLVCDVEYKLKRKTYVTKNRLYS